MATTVGPNSTEGDTCDVEKGVFSFYFTFYLAVTGVLVLCNTLLLVAIATNWNILRQNIVHVYLVSQLISSICFCVLGVYEIYGSFTELDGEFVDGGVDQRYNKSDPSHGHVMHWWAYRKALSPTIIVIMEYNIAALIYAVGDNAHFVSRFANPGAFDTTPSREAGTPRRLFCATSAKGRRFKAACLIFISWAIPLAVSIPAAVNWNCVDHCLCLPAFRETNTCFSNVSGVVCSRVWLPNTGSFVIVMTLMYFFAIVFMLTMLILVIHKFYRTHSPRRSVKIGRNLKKSVCSSGKGFRDTIPTITREDGMSSKGADTSNATGEVRRNSISPGKESNIYVEEETSQPAWDDITRDSTTSRKNGRPPLHDTIKLLIALTASFFISVTPMVIVFVYDILIYPGDAPDGNSFRVSLAITYVYSAVLPFILLAYMSGLRKACVNFLLKCPCLSTTEVKKTRVGTKAEKGRGSAVNRAYEKTDDEMDFPAEPNMELRVDRN